MKAFVTLFPIALLPIGPVACTSPAPPAAPSIQDEKIAGEENAVLTEAPAVPPPIARKQPTKVIVHLEVKEVVKQLDGNVTFTFWTFGGSVPGRFMRIRQGDLVEFHLDNHPDNKMPHNIDLHAVTGQGGGAASSFTAPGHSSVFSFRALSSGLYVYHCATAPVGMHIGNGMYGLILVEPRGGLSKVDHEYYVMQGEFYTKGAHGEGGLQPFSMQKAIDEKPEYVVFNGAAGALTDERALQAKVGDTVRLFIGNGGPNLVSSFHVIGEIFDRVYNEAGSAASENVQTTIIPSGGAAIVEFKVDVPGTYILVDHSITRAFNKGAMAHLKVTGAEDKQIYSGKINDLVYLPEGARVGSMDSGAVAKVPTRTQAERVAHGQQIFLQNCAACHQATGSGVPAAFPPLAKSDFLNADEKRAIRVVTGGLTGKVTVNGADYNGVMPPWSLNDDDIASVLTFVYSSWGNAGKDITPAMVTANRAQPGKALE